MWVIVITAGHGRTEFYGPYTHPNTCSDSDLYKDMERLKARREQLGKKPHEISITTRKIHTLHTLEQALDI